MKPLIVPAILATTPEDFARKLKALQPFAKRVHVDIADGVFAPNKTINLAQVHIPEGMEVDLHLMLEHPASELETAISLHPKTVIMHFESKDDLAPLFTQLTQLGINAGLAILPQTTPLQAKELISQCQHLLVFTGKLGFYGGEMQTECLAKIAEAKSVNSNLEVSVDGGVNEANAAQTAATGADVLVSGGYVVDSPDPKASYQKLQGMV